MLGRTKPPPPAPTPAPSPNAEVKTTPAEEAVEGREPGRDAPDEEPNRA